VGILGLFILALVMKKYYLLLLLVCLALAAAPAMAQQQKTDATSQPSGDEMKMPSLAIRSLYLRTAPGLRYIQQWQANHTPAYPTRHARQ
jgi:hypothetical protein